VVVLLVPAPVQVRVRVRAPVRPAAVRAVRIASARRLVARQGKSEAARQQQQVLVLVVLGALARRRAAARRGVRAGARSNEVINPMGDSLFFCSLIHS
jgi:hypothetical protein